MSAQSCTSPSSPFGRLYAEPQRAARSADKPALVVQPAVLETAQAPDQGLLARLWRAYCKRRSEARLRNLATDMDPHLLEDVGAPSWLINETTLRRDLTRLRNADYMRW
ncbi:hypothetical protein ACFWP0_27410 [Achromobacter sp. NPDC058515]|uniref:hypothetical protein n=1 Tax=Achromobacter sp. NPDC058515 TaxID=3346533 RepID=UPI0036646AD1